MKDKQKSLEDLDFVTELSISELEQINGGTGILTAAPRDPVPNGDSIPASRYDESSDMWDKHKPENPTNIKI
ncbi:MAG: hypothetical protein RMY34_24900 [Aulosira sp. DedQUE10]|nr:hypothetical protein [Aulosira sp. DedQUE10]